MLARVAPLARAPCRSTTSATSTRVEAIERRVAALPGLALAGGAYRGVGIPDCVRSGEAAAERVMG